ncbi:RICIN domain-containing protein, partial [Streptomyces niveiscabiei]
MSPRPSSPTPAPGHRHKHRGRRLYQRRSLWGAVALTVVGGSVAWVSTASAAVVDTDSWYVLVNRNSGEVLDGLGYATYDGAAVVQWSRHGGTNQQWRFVDSGDGNYRLLNRNSGKVLDDYGWSKTAGTALVQWSDHNNANQQFGVKKAS